MTDNIARQSYPPHNWTLDSKGEHWAVFGFLGGFSFGKSVEIIKTQTQNAPQKILSVSVLVYQFWVVLVMLEKNIAFAGIYLLNELSNLYNLYKTIITSINT